MPNSSATHLSQKTAYHKDGMLFHGEVMDVAIALDDHLSNCGVDLDYEIYKQTSDTGALRSVSFVFKAKEPPAGVMEQLLIMSMRYEGGSFKSMNISILNDDAPTGVIAKEFYVPFVEKVSEIRDPFYFVHAANVFSLLHHKDSDAYEECNFKINYLVFVGVLAWLGLCLYL